MPISARQFSYLNAIGIDLWQSTPNHPSHQQVHQQIEPQQEQLATDNAIAIDSLALTDSQLYQDILICLGLSAAEVKARQQLLDLGLFNWQFHQQDSICFSHGTLMTPVPERFNEQPALKTLLWQTLQQQQLL